jgi:beta-glucosidase
MNLLVILTLISFLVVFWLWRVMKKTFPLTIYSKRNPQEIVSQMSLNEKLRQLTGESVFVNTYKMLMAELVFKQMGRFYSGYDKKWQIPAFSFTDGPRGVVIGKNNTAWPASLARGASFDDALEERIGKAIAKEAKKSGANYFAGVTINLLRNPRWGRAQETYGEDPHLLGAMGLAMVKGVQSENVMACAKHFALNSIENSRFYLDVEIDERTLREVYLPHFQKVVEEGNVASLMSAYNLINGIRCSEYAHLLTTILRDEWGFKGFVTSDWIRGVRNGARSVKAGNDIEMPMPLQNGRKLKKALRNGEISESEIDEAVLRVIKTKMEYSRRAQASDFVLNNDKTFPEHFDLALESALKSAVLMKNNGALPINSEKTHKILVLGELAKTANLGDDGTSDKVVYPYAVSVWDGLNNYLKNTNVSIHHFDNLSSPEAQGMATRADIVIVVVGFTPKDEGEYFSSKADGPGKQLTQCGGDRASLLLNDEHVTLIEEAGKTTSNAVVVYQGGSAIVTDPWDQNVNAIVFQWYLGMEGGNALAQLLFGDANFSGKLPFTIAKSEKDLPFFDSEVSKICYEYYHGYTLMDKKAIAPAYAFGHGLSYTTFAYNNMNLDDSEFSESDVIKVRCTISNEGATSGEEIVFLFVGCENSSVDRPVKILKGFQRIALQPGESKDVQFELLPKELRYYDPKQKMWVLERTSYNLFIGSSADSAKLIKKGIVIV